MFRGPKELITNTIFSPDGSQILTASVEKTVLWDNQGNLIELADPKMALTYFNQALHLYYQLNSQGAVATTLNNISEIQATSQNWQNALKSYNQALSTSRPTGTLDAEASLGRFTSFQKTGQPPSMPIAKIC